MPQLEIFHLGHFEHSDYACSDTVRKKQGQLPLRGLFVCEILRDPARFEQLKMLYLEHSCDLTDFIIHEMQRLKIRSNSLEIKKDNTQRNVEHRTTGSLDDDIMGNGGPGFHYDDRECADQDDDDLRSNRSNNENHM